MLFEHRLQVIWFYQHCIRIVRPSTMARLVDMGVESYLLSRFVFGVIAQRLVRRLCPACKQEVEATSEEKKILGIEQGKSAKIYHKCGCEKCGQTGYKGRVGVYEIMSITPNFASLFLIMYRQMNLKWQQRKMEW